jgi:hypothetical protein
MALKSPVTLPVLVAFLCNILARVGLSRLGLVGGSTTVVVVAAAEFYAEKPNALFFNRRGADEGELRERLDVHEVVGLSLSFVHGRSHGTKRKKRGRVWGEWEREREREDVLLVGPIKGGGGVWF